MGQTCFGRWTGTYGLQTPAFSSRVIEMQRVFGYLLIRYGFFLFLVMCVINSLLFFPCLAGL